MYFWLNVKSMATQHTKWLYSFEEYESYAYINFLIPDFLFPLYNDDCIILHV